MSRSFEALGEAETPGGTIRLWRRRDPVLDVDVHEVKLGDEYLMTSLFPYTEIALAELALARLDGDGLEVAVGGLGLGFTAHAVRADPRVTSIVVVDAVEAVIDWHRAGLVPRGEELVADPRVRLVHGDWFALAGSVDGVDPEQPGRRFDALVVDIDHTPEHHLDDGHADAYEPAALRATVAHLRPGGVFALWSDGRPLDDVVARLGEVLDDVAAEIVTFDNVLTGAEQACTVYLGTRAA